MSSMKDKVFIDTNILVYASLQDDLTKHEKAISFLNELKGNTIFVSAQVMSELSVTLLKHHLAEEKIINILEQVADTFNVSATTLETVTRAWKIKKKYRFSYWDSLIVAAALENDCTLLASEDLQNGQMLDRKLRIVNPLEHI